MGTERENLYANWATGALWLVTTGCVAHLLFPLFGAVSPLVALSWSIPALLAYVQILNASVGRFVQTRRDPVPWIVASAVWLIAVTVALTWLFQGNLISDYSSNLRLFYWYLVAYALTYFVLNRSSRPQQVNPRQSVRQTQGVQATTQRTHQGPAGKFRVRFAFRMPDLRRRPSRPSPGTQTDMSTATGRRLMESYRRLNSDDPEDLR